MKRYLLILAVIALGQTAWAQNPMIWAPITDIPSRHPQLTATTVSFLFSATHLKMTSSPTKAAATSSSLAKANFKCST